MADNLLAQLLSPTLARAAEQQRLQGQVLATADARNPLLAEAGRTANLMRGSLGGLFGTDLRSPIERISAEAKAIQADPNLNEDQKIAAMKRLDPGLGAAYEQQVLATRKTRKDLDDPGYTIQEIIVGETKDVLGNVVPIKRTVVLDREGNIVRELGAGPRKKAEIVDEDEVPTEEPKGTRQAVIDDLASRLDASKADGSSVRLPNGKIVRWNPEKKSFEYIQAETPDVGGALGVNP